LSKVQAVADCWGNTVYNVDDSWAGWDGTRGLGLEDHGGLKPDPDRM
jgi:hypothetical protein